MAILRALFVLAGTLATVTASAAQLYWIEETGIHRSNLDGSGQQLVIASPSAGIASIAADVSGNRLYWIEGHFDAKIRRSNLDGTNPQDFLSVYQAMNGMAVHPDTHELWWGGKLVPEIPEQPVNRTSPDGISTVQVFTPSKPDLNQFFLDADSGHLYNLDTDDDGIVRFNLDGSNPITLSIASNAMDVDFEADKVYFETGIEIHRMNSDGTGDEPLFGVPQAVINQSLAFDPQSSTIFFAGDFPNTIYRAKVDGSGLQPIITPTGRVLQLLMVPEPSTLAMTFAALPLAYLAYRRRR